MPAGAKICDTAWERWLKGDEVVAPHADEPTTASATGGAAITKACATDGPKAPAACRDLLVRHPAYQPTIH